MRGSLAWTWRYRDLVLAGVVGAVMVVEVLAWGGAEPVVAVGSALLATVPLAARRKQPILAAAACLTGLKLVQHLLPGQPPNSFDNQSVSFVIVFFVALFSMGAHARGREVWVAGAVVVVVMADFYISDTDAGVDLGNLVFVLVFVGGPWATGLALRLRGDLAARNVELNLEQEERTRRAVAEERATIARELHDVVSHAISVTVLQSRGARRMLGRDEGAVRRALDAIEHTNTQALGDMRRLLAVLRDTEGDASTTPQPSLARLDDLVADVTDSGLEVEVRETGEDRDVPPGVDLSAYRIIQESLTNVLKHSVSGASRATVALDYEPDELRLSVRDDGRGAVEVNGHGHGLVGIRERVAVVGGEIETGPAPDGGFEVRARLPYSLES